MFANGLAVKSVLGFLRSKLEVMRREAEGLRIAILVLRKYCPHSYVQGVKGEFCEFCLGPKPKE